MIPDPAVLLGIGFILVMIHFLIGVYKLRHRHTDVVFVRYVQEAIEQGLSEEEAKKCVSMHFILESYLWPKIMWQTKWKYKFKRNNK